MTSSIKNVTKATSNTIKAATSTVAVAAELMADTTGVVASSIAHTPVVLKALLEAPFAAAKGYLMEAEQLSAEDAEAKAYHYIRQSVAETVTESSEALGSLMADLLKDDDNANTNKDESTK